MDIAIVGMAGRFPGAASVGEFWKNLADGTQGFAVTPASGSTERSHVDTRFCDIRLFEPELFGISDGEAQLLDPQHRILLECAHEALEDAGYDPWSCAFPIGLYAGSGFNHYFIHVVGPELKERCADGEDPALALLANEKDFLASRISYKLSLTGPGVTVQTACSTSLVAAHLACQTLRAYEADLCLAGGVSIDCSPERSHVYREGGVLSRDGRCRPFDADATGTTFADGAAVVVLKRLNDAVRDRDDVYAVIKGTSINNDGAAKVGYTAPSVQQYSALVQEAQGVAGVEAESIGFVEGHGTGTRLGDAVEIHALSQAFRKTTSKTAFCALGSVKSQVGHLDAAAGVTGLIKTALTLRHRLIPPTLHFEKANPALDGSPFFVNTQPLPWTSAAGPRRAAVSSLGIGGTNVHAILEEAPAAAAVAEVPPFLLVFSARSETALVKVIANVATYLRQNSGASLAQVAYTLQVGRRHHARRLALVASDAREATTRLQELVAAGSLPDERVCGCEDDRRWAEVARAYAGGADINWRDLWAGRQPPGRVHLPTYPFERRSFWLQRNTAPTDTFTTTASRDNAPHLYTPQWQRAPEPPSAQTLPRGAWVFIGHPDGLAIEAAAALEALGLPVWRGVAAERSSFLDERSAPVDLSNEQHLRSFLQWVRARAGRPEGLVFAAPAASEPAGPEPALLQVSRLARLLCETWPDQPLHLVLLAEQTSELTVKIGGLPAASPVTAAVLVGAAEYPSLRMRCLDVAEPATVFGGAPQPTRRFLHELLRQDGCDVAAFAGGYVWERGYALARSLDPELACVEGDADAVPAGNRARLWDRPPFVPPAQASSRVVRRPLLKNDGVYLITGGLGGVGLELAEYLADKGPARLALLSRRPFARHAAATLDETDGDARRRLTRVEKTGARVRVYQADAANLDDMRRVVEDVEQRWGPVNGVFHAAGLAGGALIPNATAAELARLSTPKGGGAQVLAALFAERPLDFLLLFSSTAAVFPAIGQLEYCAANMFLDVLAPVLRRDRGIAAYSVNWPHWHGVGMAAKVDASQFVDADSSRDRRSGLSRAEVRSFLDEWAAGGWPPQVIVGSLRPESKTQRACDAPACAPFVARDPDDVAATVKAIWIDLLGYADIGDSEDFFERGGDSLMAVQLIGRIRKTFGVDYSFNRFFAGPTIRDVVAFVTGAESRDEHERADREVQPVLLSK